MVVIHPKKRANLSSELKFRTTRLKAFVWVGKDTKPVNAYSFVSDIKKRGVSLFSERKLPIGDTVLVAFDNETNKPFQAKISATRATPDPQSFPGGQKFAWKCNLAFQFSSQEEGQRFIEFYLALRQRVASQAIQVEEPNYKITGAADEDLDLSDITGEGSGEGGESAA